MSNPDSPSKLRHAGPVVSSAVLLPWILITCCFALWGFANDITNPMVKAFPKIFQLSTFQGALVQFAFYGGYCVAAFPAAMFIRKYSFKAGILAGLALYVIGTMLFIPASMTALYEPFLIAYFIITCGLSFLETSANPFILSMGSEETATRRLNFSQAFNPMGSLLGMVVAKQFIVAKMNAATAEERAEMSADALKQITASDLSIIRTPYVCLGAVILVFFILIFFAKMPRSHDSGSGSVLESLGRLLKNKKYLEGVLAQFFYVGAQIMCWTFIIHYGTRIFTSAPYEMAERAAETRSVNYNIAAMIIFCCSRFVCTFLLRYIKPGSLLMILAIGGIGLTACTIILQNIVGLYCLVGVSACMSLMFPTIYGIALKGLGEEDSKVGAAGLIMAILGGAVFPPLQGLIIDLDKSALSSFALPAVNVSFVLPLICFVVIAIYGYRTHKFHLD